MGRQATCFLLSFLSGETVPPKSSPFFLPRAFGPLGCLPSDLARPCSALGLAWPLLFLAHSIPGSHTPNSYLTGAPTSPGWARPASVMELVSSMHSSLPTHPSPAPPPQQHCSCLQCPLRIRPLLPPLAVLSPIRSMKSSSTCSSPAGRQRPCAGSEPPWAAGTPPSSSWINMKTTAWCLMVRPDERGW